MPVPSFRDFIHFEAYIATWLYRYAKNHQPKS